MPTRLYRPQQLLKLRRGQYSEALVSRSNDKELADVIRINDEAKSMIAARMAADAQRLAMAHASPQRQAPTPAPESNPLPADAETEWRYRGRNSSEVTSTQPIPAPTGSVAQKDEGFQKFYRAVVSPTHVRVTAGGRIVPNTRNGASPASKWKEKHPEIPNNNNRSSMPNQPPFFVPGFAGAFPGFPLYPGFHPGMVAGGGSMPLVPIPVGYSMYGGFAVPQFAFNQLPQGSRSMSMPHGAPLPTPSYPAGMHPQPQPDRGPARDFTKPMPPAPSFGPVDYGAQPLPPRGPSAERSRDSQDIAPDATSKPPQSSIRESEITKKQLEGLRGTLKYVEDQLQYNKHQIDERSMETHAQSLRGLIQRFESTLENQLIAEGQVLPQDPKKDVSSSKPSRPASSSGSGESKPVTKPKEPPTKPVWPNTMNKNKPLLVGPEMDALTASIVPGLDSSKVPAVNGGLPVTAALAPPFQPGIPAAPAGGAAPSAPRRSLAGSGDWDRIAKMQRLPYLVGRLPPGADPAKVKDTDYIYHRQLTEDEKKARHMYWGAAPAVARKGLPKYDGKNFYPPSPVRNSDQSKESNGTSSGQEGGKRESSSENTSDEPPKENKTQDRPATSRFYTPRLSPQKGISASEDTSGPIDKKTPTHSGSETSAVEPRWPDQHALLGGLRKKRSALTSTALPGAVTSMTATGFLPQFSGQASALLSPVLASAASSAASSARMTLTEINENTAPVH